MTKIVCKKCNIEYRVVKVGASAIDMFRNPPEPYRILPCDAFQCPRCGHIVLAGFPDGSNPGDHHYDENFKDLLEKLLNSNLAKEGWVVPVYENVKDIPQEEPSHVHIGEEFANEHGYILHHYELIHQRFDYVNDETGIFLEIFRNIAGELCGILSKEFGLIHCATGEFSVPNKNFRIFEDQLKDMVQLNSFTGQN